MCKFEIVLHSFDGGLKTIKPPNYRLDLMTVLQLKTKSLGLFPNSGTIHELKLIHEGKPLDDDSAPLSRYVKPRFEMVKMVHGGKSQPEVQMLREVHGGNSQLEVHEGKSQFEVQMVLRVHGG